MIPKLTKEVLEKSAEIYADFRVIASMEDAQKIFDNVKDDEILLQILQEATVVNITTGMSPGTFLRGAIFMYKLLQEAEKQELELLYGKS